MFQVYADGQLVGSYSKLGTAYVIAGAQVVKHGKRVAAVHQARSGREIYRVEA